MAGPTMNLRDWRMYDFRAPGSELRRQNLLEEQGEDEEQADILRERESMGNVQLREANLSRLNTENEMLRDKKRRLSMWQPPASGLSAGSLKNFRGGGDGSLNPYDYGKVEGIAQRLAAPGVRRLRDAVQRVNTQGYDNPNVKSQTLRDALSGYGQGLEDVMSGAYKSASGIYGQEYGAGVQMSLAKLQADARMREIGAQNFNDSYQAYLRYLMG